MSRRNEVVYGALKDGIYTARFASVEWATKDEDADVLNLVLPVDGRTIKVFINDQNYRFITRSIMKMLERGDENVSLDTAVQALAEESEFTITQVTKSAISKKTGVLTAYKNIYFGAYTPSTTVTDIPADEEVNFI